MNPVRSKVKKTINLLPPAEQKQLKLMKLGREIQDFATWLILSVVLLSTCLLFTQWFLADEVAVTRDQATTQNNHLNQIFTSSLKQNIEKINLAVLNFQTASAQHQAWSPMLGELAQILPADVTVDSLSFSRADRKIELSGRAAHRNSVLTLRENILNSEYFQKVNFPLTNLERAVNVSWKFRFYVKPEKLKSNP